MSSNEELFVPVPIEYMGFVIGKKGQHIKEIKTKTRTQISSKQSEEGSQSGFTVCGSRKACKEAETLIMDCVVSIVSSE